ncbi:MFS transporter [Methylobacterium oryzihabitans]|uniref:MFS transporter n=1 Tax=Methylobacterium oryzihabitans TaxID=2499852 RepID=A0A3S2VA29_9HYPH|nr:MFS transporter [Methylobacterium oryzihabitans]RVU17734.1 MFS transporter [Methylobacterium oryzihabitans]
MTATAAPARLLAILAAGGFASTFAGRIAEPLVGVLARDFSADPARVALLSAAFALPYALIQPVLGPFGDALGKERVMASCLGILALSLAASVACTGIGMLFALRIVSGAAAGGVIPLALAMIGDRIPMASRQVAIGRFLFAVIFGQLAGSTVSGLVEGALGWRGVFALTTAIAVAGGLAVVLGFARALRAPAGRFALAPAIERYRTILANPRARLLFGAVFVEAIAVFGIFPHLAHLIEARGEGGPREAGLTLAGFALGGLAYTLLVGLMVRFLGQTRMLATGGLVCAGALLAVGLAGDWTLDAAALMALGLGFYMLHNTFQTQVTEVAPQARASAVALHACSFFCGQAIGVAVLGFGLATLGQFGALAACAVLIAVLGFITARRLAPPARVG